ncbi:MAG: beta-lactamase family protein [Dehalococcoidia bacterium]|nr:beta-lactamase family protein [Dehalococcoidia bacterium]
MAFIWDARAERRTADALERAVAEQRVPGINVAVVIGDEVVYSGCAGFADIEARAPMTPLHRQRIASITKTMVGLSVMALVDEGRLRLDDLVRSHLPEIAFRGPAEEMRVRHLLTHTSGIGEAPTLESLRNYVNPDPDVRMPPGPFASMYPDGVVVDAPAGTKWAYANHGFALLGEILVRAEDASLQEVLERRIFGPLGMAATDILGQPSESLATGYHRAPSDDTRAQLERAGIPVPDEPTIDGLNIRGKFTLEFHEGMNAAGGVQSNIPDMARYASALLRRGAGIVQPATFDAMVAPQWCPDDRLVSWGLAFVRAPRFGRQTFGHGGAYFGGWNSNVMVVPEDNVAVVQHMNIMLDEPAPVFNAVARAIFDVAAPADEAPPPVDPSVLETAPGIFECPPGRLTNFRPVTRVGRIELYREGDALVLRSRRGAWKAGLRLQPLRGGGELYELPQTNGERPRVVLTRDATGRVDGLRFDDCVHMVRAGA